MRLYSTPRGIGREDETGKLSLLDLPYTDLGEVLLGPGLHAIEDAPTTVSVPLDDIELKAPVERPGKVLIVGYNYPSHGDEAREAFAARGRDAVHMPEKPNFQLAAGTAVTGPFAPIVLPEAAASMVDYEGEVAIVVGKTAKNVPPEEAWGHVAGLTVINDVSARDIQGRAMEGDLTASIGTAKSFDSFKPLGPCLVTADEFDECPDLRLTTRVNGEIRQDDRTGTFVYTISELLSYLSEFMTLEPGDVICTGTPRGVGIFAGQFLQRGDVVEIEVERIGTIKNQVISA